MERIKRYVAVAVLECFFASNISVFMMAETPVAPWIAVSTQSLTAAGAPAAHAASAERTASSAEIPVMRETSQEVTPEGGGKLELEGAVLEIPPGAVEKPVMITLRSLPVSAALADGMQNATCGAQAYRFEPHGTQFQRPVYVSLPFDREMLDSETALSNLYTYFYNEWAGRWERLPRLSLDREKALVRSETTHFTDMINATLKLPEGPSPISFDVNSIKNLEAADPSAGVPKLEGLEGGQQGSASFQIALRLPAGRGGATPRLALAYSSENPNSWLGRGFDISVPAVSIDTKFGLPRYDGTDTYVLAGEKLVEDGPDAEGTRYRPLTEKMFQKILRRQSGGEIYWEVTDKSGAVSEYGRGEGWIGPVRADHARVYTWYLTKTRDAFGNTVEYDYSYDAVNAFTYLDTIRYSGFEGSGAPEEGAYRIVFRLQETDRPDRRIDSRGKFPSKLARLLGKVDVYYRSALVRSYIPAYTSNVFGQSQLETWTETDALGNPFYTYAFDYYELAANADGYDGFDEEEDWAVPAAGAGKTLSSSANSSVGASLYTGLEFFIWLPFVGTQVIASVGITGGYNFSTGMSLGSLLDINGDGLPDMVWKSGDTLQSYLNRNGAFIDTFGVSGLNDSMDKDTQNTVSIGGSAGLCGVSGALNYQYSWIDGVTGFADVNGDGFTDFLTKSGAQFGLNNGVSLPGQMALVPTTWTMTGAPPSGAQPDPKADTYNKVYYRQEPVRKWRAYRSGTVEVEQSAQLQNGDSASLDGVRLYTYSEGGSDVISLSRGAQSGSDSSEYAIDKDDPLYFRMETGDSERGDETRWTVRIGYTSVRFFEEMANVAEIIPPPGSTDQLPFGDPRLEPIYQVTSIDPLTYALKADWRGQPEEVLAIVYEALIENACFIPKKLAKADMDLLLAACAGGPYVYGDAQNPSVAPQKALLTGFRYVNETQTLYRMDNRGDEVLRTYLKSAFTAADLKRIGYYTWLDGSRVMPRESGGQYRVKRSAPVSAVAAQILDDEAQAAAGETVWLKGILLDRFWSSDEPPSVVERTWLREDGLGGWKLFVQDEDGEREVTPADLSVEVVGMGGLSVSFTDRGVKRTFELSGSSIEIKRLGRGAYEGPVSQAVMRQETFSTYSYESIPAAALDSIIDDLGEVDGNFVAGCYELEGGEYRLIPATSDDDLHVVLGLIEPYARRGGSIFDIFSAPQAARRFVRLSQVDYGMFMQGQDALIAGCFESYTEVLTTFYHQRRDLSITERTALQAAMYSYRRDAELFPYFSLDPGTGVRTLKTGLSEEESNSVRLVMLATGLSVYEEIKRTMTYGSATIFPVTPGTLPDGAAEVSDAPRGAMAALPGTGVGVVSVPDFDAEGRTLARLYYLHIYDSAADYSAQNLSRIVDPTKSSMDPYLACNGEYEPFHGGVYGWYYGAWTGYYPWTIENIGKVPPKPASGETSSPPYFEAMDPNRDPGDGSIAIVTDGKGAGLPVSADAWIGKVSESSEPVMDETGSTATLTYAYAAFIDRETMHPSRNGGEAYYKIPINAAAGSPGSLPYLRSSESSTLDTNGGVSVSIGGVSLGGSVSRNTGTSWQTQGLMDLNGDRYPDLVDFGGYDGSFSVKPGTGLGFGPSVSYATPFPCISFYQNDVFGFGASLSSSAGGIKIDYDEGKPFFATIKDPGAGGSIGANGTLGSSYQTQGFIDINGDGLPDHVQRSGTGGYSVALNTGAGSFLSPALDWGSGITVPSGLFEDIGGLPTQPSGLSHSSTGSFGASIGFTVDGAVVGVGASAGFTGTVNQTYTALIDVNGDGLSDQVAKLKDEPFFRVRFNLGDCFSPTETRLYRPEWRAFDPAGLRSAINLDLSTIASNLTGVSVPGGAPDTSFTGLPADSANGFSSVMDPFRVDDVLNYASGTSFNLGASLTVRITFTLLALTIKAGVNGSWASTSATLEFGDVDGDGLPDHVMKLPYEPFVRVKPNALGRVGLLRAVTLPLGGSYEVEYARAGNTVDMPLSAWVLSAVTRSDGGELLSADRGEHSYRVEHEYSDGYYDRARREFRGFGQVDSLFVDGSRQSVWRYNRQYYTRGMEWKRELTGPAGGGVPALLIQSLKVIEQQSEGYYDGREVVFPRVRSEITRLYDPAGGQFTETEVDYRYDRDLGQGNYGNIAYIEDKGSTGVTGDELYTWIGYADLEGYLKQHPESVRVEGAGGVLMRMREGEYGSRGELIRQTQFESAAVGRAWTIGWDRFGNMRSNQDPRGYTESWEYDEETQSRIVRSRSSNPVFGGPVYVSSSTWDYRLGVETSRTDVAGQTMSYIHDGFGRLVEVRSPYDEAGSLPAVSYLYQTSSAPWYVVTRNKVLYDPDDAQMLNTVTYVDGLGRLLQTAKQGERWQDGSRQTGWTLGGAVAYDAKGRTVAEGQPVFAGGDAIPGLASMMRPTLKGYDSLDRMNRVTLPDGSTSLTSFFIRDGRWIARTTDPKLNSTERTLDGRVNTVAVRKLDALEAELTRADYSYNALGEILEVIDFAGKRIRSSYDLMGRRVRLESADTGVVDYDYDESGNLSRKVDSVLRARGQAIQYFYDGLNRLTRVDYPKSADLIYVYGEQGAADGGAGRIVSLVDESGSVTCSYGRLGEIVETRRTINRLTPIAQDESASLSYRYDYLGRIQGVTYPDSEEVSYSYDAGGQVKSVTGVHFGNLTVYVEEIGYDEFGQRTYIKYGNGVETRYAYDPDRRWLDTIGTNTDYGAVYQAMNYSFDEVGNVLGVVNTAAEFQTQTAYGYDALYRLTHAEGTITAQRFGMADYSSRYTQDFTFNSVGNLTSKISTLSTTPAKTIGAALDYEFDYVYYPGKANQAEHIGDLWYRYDANGNVTEEREGGHSELPPGDAKLTRVGDVRVVNRGFGLSTGDPQNAGIYQRNFIWNEENRITRSVDSNITVDYRYGADGERAIKYSTVGETLYFNPLWQAATDYPELRQSKHIYVGSTRIATRCNIKGYQDSGYEELNTFYYHPDHLGSAQLVTDYEGEKYEHMEFTPYGELWVEETSDAVSKTPFRFTGKEMDEETGLYYFGARYLNPRTCMWLSSDPAIEKYLPVAPIDGESREYNNNLPGMGGVFNTANLTGYRYAGNNPLKYTDPNGELFFIDDALGWVIGTIFGGRKDEFFKGVWSNFTNSWALVWNTVWTFEDNKNLGDFLVDVFEFIDRFTWDLPFTVLSFLLGYGVVEGMQGEVSKFQDLTMVMFDGSIGAMTLGCTAVGDKGTLSDPVTQKHEFGHYVFSLISGPFYLFHALQSLFHAIEHGAADNAYFEYQTEVAADQLGGVTVTRDKTTNSITGRN